MKTQLLAVFFHISILFKHVHTKGPCSRLSCLIGCGKPLIYEDRGIEPIHPKAANSIGVVVNYKCFKGLEYKRGGKTSRCLPDATWTTPNMECVDSPTFLSFGFHECSPIPEREHTLHDSGTRGNQQHSNVSYWCEDGYSSGTVKEMRIQCDYYKGGWTVISQSLDCKELCGHLDIAHVETTYQGPAEYGTRVQITCKPGYRLRGSGSATCSDDGKWTNSNAECLEISCPWLTKPENGYLDQQKKSIGATLTYDCDKGYRLVGDAMRVCQQSGFWSGEEVMCQEIACPWPTKPENGYLDLQKNSIGSTLTYGCDKGYRLVGDAIRVCQENGFLSSEEVMCQAITCVQPSVTYGHCNVTDRITYAYMDQVNCRCNKGYHLNGSMILRCISPGVWFPASPECVHNDGTTVTPQSLDMVKMSVIEMSTDSGTQSPQPPPKKMIAAVACSVGISVTAIVVVTIYCIKDRKARRKEKNSKGKYSDVSQKNV